MSVFNALNAAVYTTLSGGTALVSTLGGTAIFYQRAPDGYATPYVVWSYQAGGDENITPSRMKNMLLYIRGYSTNAAQAGTIDAQIDALIHGQTLTVSGWSNFWTAREDDISLVEYTPSGEIYSAGGVYRVRLT